MEETGQEDHDVLSKGLFYGGGIGTYLFLGKTNSGKNHFLKHAICQSFLKVANRKWDQVIVYSKTAALTDDWEFLSQLYDSDSIVITSSEDDIKAFFEHRKKYIEHLKAIPGISQSELRQYIYSTSILLILDDYAGVTNTSSSANNFLFHMVTMSRHLGIWMCMLCQYSKSIGPGFYQNCRAVISFDANAKSYDTLSEHINDQAKYLPQQIKKQIISWPSQRKYACTVWWNAWSGMNQPTLPWMLLPVDMNRFVLMRNRLE